MAELGVQIIRDFRHFVEEFKAETDRAIVVLTAARLDYLLFAVLQKYLVPNASKTDDFFENQGPGSSFSNKIILAYRLGLIDRDFARTLNIIRSIRNDFAHETSACSLEKGSHKDRVQALAATYQRFGFIEEFKKDFFEGTNSTRADYMSIVGIMIIRLQFFQTTIEPINCDKAWPVVTEAMRQPAERKQIEGK